MIYLLDTNAVSALMKANAALVDGLVSHAPGDISPIPQLVIAVAERRRHWPMVAISGHGPRGRR